MKSYFAFSELLSAGTVDLLKFTNAPLFRPKMKFILVAILLVIFTSTCENASTQKSAANAKTFKDLAFGRALRAEFLLNPNFIQLNHGAYGTYPKAVQSDLHKFQARAEGNSDLWLRRDVKKELIYIRKQLAEVVNAAAEDVVVVPNTTSGINAILRSMVFQAGDRILHFSTVYNSMKKIIQYLEDYSGGNVTSVEFVTQYPISNDEIVSRFEQFVNTTPNIKLALIDHISSSPGSVIPIDRLIPICKAKGILVLIDGAHAIGQIPVDLTALAPDYYITNAHKWLYAARGTALLYVDKKHQGTIHPALIASPYSQPTNFQEEFFWTGTMDYCPYMTVTAALEFRRKLGGEAAVMAYTHGLALEGAALMVQILGTSLLQTEDQIGNMFDVILPLDNPDDAILTGDFWIDTLLDRTNIFVGTSKMNGVWSARVSSQVYIDITDYEHAAQILKAICVEVNRGTIGSGPILLTQS